MKEVTTLKMNKVVKEMFELSKTDKYRKAKKIKWDMYYLYMGYKHSREVMKRKAK